MARARALSGTTLVPADVFGGLTVPPRVWGRRTCSTAPSMSPLLDRHELAPAAAGQQGQLGHLAHTPGISPMIVSTWASVSAGVRARGVGMPGPSGGSGRAAMTPRRWAWRSALVRAA